MPRNRYTCSAFHLFKILQFSTLLLKIEKYVVVFCFVIFLGGWGVWGCCIFVFVFWGFFIGFWGFFALIMTCINLRVPLCNDNTVALNQK